MKGIYLMLVTIYTYVFLATSIKESPAQCFHFSWSGRSNCMEHNSTVTPCIIPLFESKEKPNAQELYEIWENQSERLKDMGLDNICVKFTYMYNSVVVNISYFHGKVTEDKVTPINSGCYVQYTEGYAIEVCACKSEARRMPCNSTIRNTYSAVIIFAVAAVSLFMYKIFDIP